MKTETKAVLASLIVLTLVLTSVGGVTYSWFSVSHEYDVSIETAKLDVDYELESDGSVVSDAVRLEKGDNNLTLYVTNNNAVPLAFKATFSIPRYTAYHDNGGTSPIGELLSSSSTEVDQKLESEKTSGRLANSLNAITVGFNEDVEKNLGVPNGNSIPTGDSSLVETTTVGGDTWYIIQNLYSASYSDSIAPFSRMEIPITVTVGDGYTEGSCLDPIIEAVATQSNANVDGKRVQLQPGDNGVFSGSFNISDVNGRPTQVIFQDVDGRFSVTLNWQTVATSGLERIDVEITETDGTISIDVSGYGSDSVVVTLDGRIGYSLSIDCDGITGVTDGSSAIQSTIKSDNGRITVAFTDLASSQTHTITYNKQAPGGGSP